MTYSNYDKKIKAAVTTADVSPKDDKGIYRENDKKYVIIKDDTLKIGSKSSPLTRYVKWQDAIHSNTKNGYKYFPGDGQGDPPFITDVEPVIKGKVTLSDGTSFQNPVVDDCLFFTDATSTEDLIAKLPNIVKTLVFICKRMDLCTDMCMNKRMDMHADACGHACMQKDMHASRTQAHAHMHAFLAVFTPQLALTGVGPQILLTGRVHAEE